MNNTNLMLKKMITKIKMCDYECVNVQETNILMNILDLLYRVGHPVVSDQKYDFLEEKYSLMYEREVKSDLQDFKIFSHKDIHVIFKEFGVKELDEISMPHKKYKLPFMMGSMKKKKENTHIMQWLNEW